MRIIALQDVSSVFIKEEDWWKFATSIGVGIVVLCCWWLESLTRIWERRRELDGWIREARAARDSKQFQVLQMNPAAGRSKDEFPSVAETTQQIQTKSLDMCENIVHLAHRCRQYGRDENGCNAITEEMYDDAYEQAQALSRENGTNNNESKQPVLFGVPISVKDQYAIKGYLQTGGLACRLKSPAMKDSLIIQLLKNAGAIPLCGGNTVQTMMLPECVNRIWGRSRNPWYVLTKRKEPPTSQGARQCFN
jgi:hypothetical protein